MTETRLTMVVWLFLVALTILGYTIGEAGMSGTTAMAILLSAAFVKSQLVISHFMELKKITGLWKWIPSGWLVLVLLAIAITYP